MIDYLILVPIAYLLGSVPFGLIAGKIAGNMDIREHGSGNIGMTNVQRTVGTPAAALVLLLDMGKAALAVVVARIFFDSTGVEAAAALAVVFGHNWPIFIRFRGGKGTASGWGGLIALSPIAGLVAMLVGVPLIAVTRYVSLGSVSAAVLGCLSLIIMSTLGHLPLSYIWFGAIGSVLVVVRHRENIQRLLSGTERKLGQRAEAAS
ncbi:MAG: glycerol-3-phosphate 1-O-acyltransferase PlsY [SAR202 cluster bacterium]|jgi:glycerol-3-phosphate acyltransferase PlsY|nr:glycerol-3-phosphate 1-O-acyltransferase PlsY [SAR202 cluster bacterium]MDP6714008.1 glycerol-3-phosphate 1-O-acyltransferase PlsY [SAR202 cluster bacterium]